MDKKEMNGRHAAYLITRAARAYLLRKRQNEN